MSQKYILSCNQCAYSSVFKIGRSSDQDAWQIKIKDQILSNHFGEETKLFLENHPDVKINAFWAVYTCPSCGRIRQRVRMRMQSGEKTFAYRNYCDDCGARMAQVSDILHVHCPSCKQPLKVESI
ncbi:MAG: hypothetical protein GXY06_03070 [Clostridiaceae bacterium]|nr:hypothetical protein [Clostridiaceae bacterium]